MSGFSRFLAFACAARHRSFARAGRELAVTPSTVAKRIGGLEQELGVKLFHRTTRQVTLTVDGEVLYARCEKILADIGELENLAAGANAMPRGELRLNLPITYGKRVVMPVLTRLLRTHPELRADVRLSDQQCDLIKEGMDAAVRIMPLVDSRLASRQVDEQALILCASPAYLQEHGRPSHPAQLHGHGFIVFRNPTSGRERPVQLQAAGEVLDLHPAYRMIVDDGEGMVQAARHGAGLTQVPDYMAAEEMARGRLVEVLADFRPPAMPVCVVWPGNRLMPARVRAFIDALAAHCGQTREGRRT
ncbi:transcriptional regulator, LysR family [Noviherbaspirillum humi]|uniref:Transcriptional regulator, LysR family n=1 Tax=Noviherbaspirillum humi TaxID=1688639 RepID=A0A239J248_9BURK|nr:LysR family transcriptional regulator [Noviherbaspirillum humi]SNT00001.1 transcriptional regulator, LysR family [Noviherbaspirillum humi]